MVGDRCARLSLSVNSMLPEMKYQRCTIHFMRNVLSKTSPAHRAWTGATLKAVLRHGAPRIRFDRGQGGRIRNGI
ncbi:hypothetical protein DWZ91_05305 [Bifidobacterium pseudocatenulatum]|uniref:Mutator family transposase n=1 Tax=Bifidobacterium pseudocatenulatum TaxID=28026 RepID=A0AAQ0LV95_BIFPS|nr:hypothetical protein DWZ91_05305 [Bifidobacterium pseudocatenulatum]